MAYYIPPDVIEALRGSHNLGIFMSLQTDPPLHIWFGVNDIPARIDSVDAEGTVYQGGGRLIGVPTLETQVNGTSDSVEFTLSGIDVDTGTALADSIPEVRGRDLYVGLTTLDEYYQPMSAIIPIWQGRASHTGEASQAVSGTENRTMSLSLLVTTGSDTRSRSSSALWSSAQHKSVYSTDLFFDNTATLARGVQPKWPKWS